MSENKEAIKAANRKEIRKGPKIAGRIILITVVIAGLCFGLYRGIDGVKYISTDDASIDGEQIDLSSRILGRIDSIHVAEGQSVQKGDVLISLDNTDLKAQENQARAALSSARQNLVLAQINLEKNRDDYNRISSLYRNSAATRESYEHASSANESARAQYNLAQAQVDTAEAQLGVLEAQLLNTSIESPMDGTVNEVSLAEGDIVQPGKTILSISNLDKIWLIANVEETSIRKVIPGAKVLIRVDACGGRTFYGTVEMIRAGIVPPAFQIGEFTKTTQRIPVRIKFDEPGGSQAANSLLLLPGMSAEVKIRIPANLSKL